MKTSSKLRDVMYLVKTKHIYLQGQSKVFYAKRGSFPRVSAIFY